MKQAIVRLLRVCFYSCGFLFAVSITAIAQVVPDGTVDTKVERAGSVAEITGGETRGKNLFHSFEEFSIPTGNEAFFNNANDITSIFSRVTGGRISDVDGAIRANGSANLFLINPAGIIFNENASLDLGGSFYGSTASSIVFEEGEFRASDPKTEPILTISVPIGLRFEDNPGDIINNSIANNGRGLEVVPGKDIALIGGNVSFDGGFVFAPGGTAQLGGLTTKGTLEISDRGRLNFPVEPVKGDVYLANGGQVSVSANGGGSIFVDAKNLDLDSGSSFIASILPALGSANIEGGDITVTATDTIRLNGTNANNIPTGIINRVENDATGDAGNIEIIANSLALTDGGEITSSTFGQGNSGNVSLNIAESIIIDASGNSNFFAGIFNSIQQNAVGSGGDIDVKAKTLTLSDGGQITATISGRGNSGDISLDITESVSINGATDNSSFSSTIANSVETDAIGDAGKIDIAAGSLTLSNGGQISSSTLGKGNNGDISLDIAESVSIKGVTDNNSSPSIVSNLVGADAIGDAGKIDIAAGSLALSDGGQINANTLGQGNSGNISLDIAESIFLDKTSPIADSPGAALLN